MRSNLRRTLILYALFLAALGSVILCVLQANRLIQPTEIVREEVSGSSQVVLAETEKKLNINTASAEELQSLSGIGEVLAERILAYREENGPFHEISELIHVDGIGQKLLESLAPHICT